MKETMLGRIPSCQCRQDHADCLSNEKLSLAGGLSQTGRPAEIVRVKDGKSISLRTGEEVQEGSPSQGLKRSMSEESDEDMMRSMARRRKSALPIVKDPQKCSECDKTFKRPCDLTSVLLSPYANQFLIFV